MIGIDASLGSGGGVVLRGALALAVLTGRAVRLTRIRARRTSPGLKPQHLRIIELLARLSNAYVDGAVIGSQTLVFEPRRELGLDSRLDSDIDIDTPGSLTLLLQTLLLPLSFAGRVSHLRLVGVTHAPRSPAYENLALNWLPQLEHAGYRAEVRLQAAGFAPKGGGIVHATIHPATLIEPLHLLQRGALLRISGQSVVACLDPSVAERQRLHILSRLQSLGVPISIVSGTIPAAVPGTYIVLLAEFEHSQQCFFALGELGKPPETVAAEASDALMACLDSGGALDAHQASQLLLPLSFANGDSALSASRISEHMLVTAELINRFLPDAVSINGQVGEPGQLMVRGCGVPQMANRGIAAEAPIREQRWAGPPLARAYQRPAVSVSPL
ncbi:RNA 3'-terminal phosphate cyclase [Propionivibrio sp.]|uniref:RNA 3'-terminal phosphate cyclase n=1 Tax=Propionivibrio sp. TaxID=2212460 RepID=UPI003BF35CA3